MNDIQRQIQEALMRRSTDVEPEPGAYGQIQHKIARTRRLRAVGGGLLAVAAVAAIAIIVPRVTDGPKKVDTAGPLPSGSTSATPSNTPAAPAIPAGWSVMRHEADGYWFALPDDWKTGVFEGQTSYRPPGLGSAEEGRDTFFVEIFVNSGTPLQLSGDKSEAKVAGYNATRYETNEGDSRGVAYEVRGWECYAGPDAVAKCQQLTLYVIVKASTQELWDRYGPDTDQMVRSLHNAKDPMPQGDGFRTTHGRVAAGIPLDRFSRNLILFMEARVFGDSDTAKSFLTKEALALYDSHKDGLDLYEPDSSRGLSTYTITERREADASSVEFDVRLVDFPREGNQAKTATATETLGIGASDNYKGVHGGPFIRFATRQAP